MPSSFAITMTRSTASAPICAPQDPPVMVKNAGELQPLAVRHVATPRPCCPPNTNPPLIMDGTTATHLAFSRMLAGMVLSGVFMSSSSTLAESFSRSKLSALMPETLEVAAVPPVWALLRCCVQPIANAIARLSRTEMVVFIGNPSSFLSCMVAMMQCTCNSAPVHPV